MNWDNVRLFLAIARTGTLTAAAPLLQLSQPTAGRRLRALEAACGCALFQRTASGLRLTDEGELMLGHAERMEDEALALERQLGGQERELEGQLRLSSSEWFGRAVLAPRLAEFTLAHPAITLELVADSRPLDLERREADLVFRFARYDGPDIVATRFVRIEYALFASRDYLAQARGEHRLVAMDRAFESLPDVAWLRRRYPGARLAVRSNSRDVQAEACARGAGLAVLPRVIGEALGLTRLDTGGDPPPSREIWLGYHADLRRLKRLRTLIEFLTRAIGPEI